jgi:hypothetical protein
VAANPGLTPWAEFFRPPGFDCAELSPVLHLSLVPASALEPTKTAHASHQERIVRKVLRAFRRSGWQSIKNFWGAIYRGSYAPVGIFTIFFWMA